VTLPGGTHDSRYARSWRRDGATVIVADIDGDTAKQVPNLPSAPVRYGANNNDKSLGRSRAPTCRNATPGPATTSRGRRDTRRVRRACKPPRR
jgi:hypothetical protein